MATFIFSSALVKRDGDKLRVRFFARDNDQMVLGIGANPPAGKPYGKNARIQIAVDAKEGPQVVPSLPLDEETYEPGIEFIFSGALTASLQQVDGRLGLVVESEGAITCVETQGMPWSVTDVCAAGTIKVSGDPGPQLPHGPK